ncbi:MAG: hypothetical protein ACREHG_03705 [Candidatus Saccharimonadales bacterium]
MASKKSIPFPILLPLICVVRFALRHPKRYGDCLSTRLPGLEFGPDISVDSATSITSA